MRIITVSRQFGSGGRELGKRLADVLGWDYYDREIIERLAEDEGLDEEYVRRVLHEHAWSSLPLTFQNSFALSPAESGIQAQLLARQRSIIEDIARTGHDCIIVGRDADVILEDYKPFRIYVCADFDFRLARCLKREQKNEGKQLTEKEIARNIRRIDRNRSLTREILTGKSRDDSSCFEITVNSSSWDMKRLAAAVAEMALKWFEA